MNLKCFAYQQYVGGIYIVDSLRKAVQAEGTITLDFATMDPAEFKKLTLTIRQGFTASRESTAMAVLKMLHEVVPEAPKIPQIGYLGKREMSVLIAAQNAEQYRTDLIAAGHMVDVDLSQAASLGLGVTAPDGTRLRAINVSSYNIGTKGSLDAAKIASNWRVRRNTGAGMHLRPATSKLANLVKQWTLETYHTRSPLVDWINTKPRLTWSLSPPK